MSKPVSVYILTKDRPDSLAVCLFSLLKQVYSGDIEIIIVDDGNKSCLDSPIINEQISMFKDISDIKNNIPIGMAKSRNVGIKAAKHDLLIKMDDDHYCDADMVGCLMAARGVIASQTGEDKVGCLGTYFPFITKRRTVVRPTPKQIGTVKIEGPEDNPKFTLMPDHEYGQLDLVVGTNCVIPATVLRGVYMHDKEQLFDESLSMVSHTEETRHSWAVYCSGKQNWAVPAAVCWHMHDDTGGVRSFTPQEADRQRKLDEVTLNPYMVEKWKNRIPL
jgi:GT2 family glycosyltransferase